MTMGYILNIVGNKLKIPLLFDQMTFRSLEAVEQLLIQTGFEASRCFTIKSYGDTMLVVEMRMRCLKESFHGRNSLGGHMPDSMTLS